MYRTTSVMALGLFLGLAPIGALAQTDDTDTQQQELTQPSDTQQSTDTETLETDDEQATDTDTLQSDDQQATDSEPLETDDDADMATDTEADTDTDTAAEEPDAATDDEADVAATDEEEVPDVIPEQDTSEMLGSSLMGASVNLADEEIGNVSDLIIDQDNQVRGVVVGVGGFLGIGEKRVALPVERLTLQATEPGEVEISTDMTREELEEKEAFRTAAEIRQEEEAAEAEQQQQQDMQQQQTLE